MDIALTPDTYTPSINAKGNYVDDIPIIKSGLMCLCGTRKDKVYADKYKFSTHTKSKKHQRWIAQLNQNKANYYVESIKHLETVENQKKIIGHLENQLQTKGMTIDLLTKQLVTKANITVEIDDLLLDIN